MLERAFGSEQTTRNIAPRRGLAESDEPQHIIDVVKENNKKPSVKNMRIEDEDLQTDKNSTLNQKAATGKNTEEAVLSVVGLPACQLVA